MTPASSPPATPDKNRPEGTSTEELERQAARGPQSYAFHAINLFDAINIKTVRTLLSGKVLDSSPQQLHLQYGENGHLFVYRFGSLVFFNMSAELVQQEIGRLRSALGNVLGNPTEETYQLVLADGPAKVEFEHVELKKITPDSLRVIGITIGQSAALEYFEVRADRMLSETTGFMGHLSRSGLLSFQTNKILETIGSTASTRQYIISNLAILDPPDEAWKSKELERLFRELQNNFDIEVRFRALDRKLSLVQSNLELLAGLIETRRTNMLEALIVILILIEIVLAFAKP
jgi:uncharacterized Rmd1/YagE family protein